MPAKLAGVAITVGMFLLIGLGATRYAKVAGLVILGLYWGLILLGSVYKLAMLYRHRRDPATRDRLLCGTWVFPRPIERLLFDERQERRSATMRDFIG